jgi:hypothetical protein
MDEDFVRAISEYVLRKDWDNEKDDRWDSVEA